jgi:hypothetical protein
MDDYWGTTQFEKLLGAVAAEPRSLPGTHDYGDVHSI